jgi:hypothetical protein
MVGLRFAISPAYAYSWSSSSVVHLRSLATSMEAGRFAAVTIVYRSEFTVAQQVFYCGNNQPANQLLVN